MPSSIPDIRLTVRNLLRDHIQNDQLPESVDTRAIQIGWYDGGLPSPQVSVSNDEESPVSGGETGYSGYAGDGSGRTQQRGGTVLVNLWLGTEDEYDENGLVQLQGNELKQQVEDIVHLADSNSPRFGLRSLSVQSARRFVDTDETPPEFRVELQVAYSWLKTPPAPGEYDF